VIFGSLASSKKFSKPGGEIISTSLSHCLSEVPKVFGIFLGFGMYEPGPAVAIWSPILAPTFPWTTKESSSSSACICDGTRVFRTNRVFDDRERASGVFAEEFEDHSYISHRDGLSLLGTTNNTCPDFSQTREIS